MPWSLYNRLGQRKYLTKAETLRFLRAADAQPVTVRHFCWVLAASGCRISEGLALTIRNFDFQAGTLVIASLKKRGKRVFRAIPLPRDLLRSLKKWFTAGTLGNDQRLWPWSRMTGYRRVCEVMYHAGISGDFASPKGLRHGFGINAVQSGVPLNLVQRWLGHADLKTTAIYTSAMGPEEREIASRMWHPARKAPAREPGDCIEQHIGDKLGYDAGTQAAGQIAYRVPSNVGRETELARIVTEAACIMRHFWLFCNPYFPLKSAQ